MSDATLAHNIRELERQAPEGVERAGELSAGLAVLEAERLKRQAANAR